MITVSSTIRELLENKYRQVVRITVSNTSPSLTITAEDIAQGGLSIDRYCVSGSSLEMGSAIASELTLTLLNYDGRFDDVSFEGKELHVEQGVIDDEDETHWFDMGYFKVDTPPRKKSTINITALDRMVKFDEEAYAWSSTQTYPMTVASFVSAVCTRCVVTLGTTLTNFPNANVSITKDPITDESITFRNIIQWAAAIMGTCAYIDESGELIFGWLQDTDVELTSENRYQGADLYENDVTITGYIFTETVESETEDEVTTEDATYVAGTIVYPIDLTGNPFITGNIQSILNAIYTARGTVTYRPFECTTFPYPFIMPLDKITYTDPNGNDVSTIVTNAVHNLNRGSALASKGETSTSKSYSSGSGFTPSQSKELTKTQILIEAASQAAASAQISAEEAQESAGIAYTAAEEAKESARSANASANNALVQLSVVEDVAGTLNWISKNGTYVPTEDTTVRSNTVYFVLQGGDYVPIANPPAGSNPSALGWYVLDISSSQAEYIMAHLAVTSAGLWVLPVNGYAPHFIYDSAGNILVDSDGIPIVDATLEPQNATGYKVLLSSGGSSGETTFPVGLTIYDDEGAVVANYGVDATIGKTSWKHLYISPETLDIMNGDTVLASYGENIALGAEDAEIRAVLTSSEFQFRSKDSEDPVAYFNSDKLYVQRELSFGNFALYQRTNGHLSIKYTG